MTIIHELQECVITFISLAMPCSCGACLSPTITCNSYMIVSSLERKVFRRYLTTELLNQMGPFAVRHTIACVERFKYLVY